MDLLKKVNTATVTITTAAGEGYLLKPPGTRDQVSTIRNFSWYINSKCCNWVASDIDIFHYHIISGFPLCSLGVFFMVLYATADVGTFSNVTDIQNYAQGES